MFKKVIKFLFKWTFILGSAAFLAVVLPRTITTLASLSKMHTAQDSPSAPVAVVFGAGLRRDGGPALVLRRRIEAAVDLYKNDKVEKLLMSGAAPEPTVMRDYAVRLGVPAEDILLDDGGLRTYDSCYRAKQEYDIQEAILVTQDFHLPRALYLCSALGIQAQGVYTEEGRYWRGAMFFWQIRETLATVVAFSDLYITQPTPEYQTPSPEES